MRDVDDDPWLCVCGVSVRNITVQAYWVLNHSVHHTAPRGRVCRRIYNVDFP